jgi:hypothetical protein
VTDVETKLRNKLRTAVEPSPEPISVDAVASRVRTRRRRLTATAAVGVALALAIPAVIVATDDDAVRTGDTRVPPAVRPTDLGVPPRGEVDSLSLGEPPNVPWSYDKVLHVGAQEIPVPGTGGPDVIGAVDGGWFLLVEHEQFHPYSFRTEYGILHADGAFKQLPNLSSAPQPYVQEATVSPAGDQVAGRTVVDVTTGDIVATVPGPAQYMVGWGPSGIVYDEDLGDDGTATSMLWTPGNDPIPLARDVTQVVGGSSRVITGELGPCGDVSDLRSDGTLTTLWRGCHGMRPDSLSPDGTKVLTGDLSVVDVDTGDVVTRLYGLDEPDTAPPLDRVPSWEIVWEDSAHLVFPVDNKWLVRCAVPAMRCERAAGPLQITPGKDINFVGPN